MSNIVRSSKYRHILGKDSKDNYNSIKATKSSADSKFCAVNPKFVAVVLEGQGGGPFLVLPLKQVGRVQTTPPVVNGHKNKITELAWYPFNDNLIASASEDTTVMLWEIPDEGLKENMEEPWQELKGHEKKVTQIEWHPTAEYILASGAADSKVIVWNVPEGEPIYTFEHPDLIYCIAWNYNGSLLATTCRDKTLRIYDPRQKKVIQENAEAFPGTKSSKCAFLKDGRLFAVGFSKRPSRIYSLFDSKDLSKPPLSAEEIDTGNGVIHLHIDTDNNVVFMAEKGSTHIRYYEVTKEEPYVHYLTLYQSQSNMRGFAWMPKRGLDVTTCEIARCYRVTENSCESTSLVVPRKSENFQEDIYPPCKCDEPSMTAAEWLEGKNAEPKTMSTKAMFEAAKGGSVRVSGRKARLLAPTRSGKGDASAEEEEWKKFMDDMKKMRVTLENVCKRLVAVEKKVGINASEKFN